MSCTSRVIKTGLILATLTGVVIWVNAPLMSVGAALHDADQFLYPMAAESYQKWGEWSVFPFGQQYGGTSYTWLRALWLKIILAVWKSTDARVWGQFAFSYYVSPALLAMSSYFLVAAFCSQTAAFLAALVTATGYQYILNLAGLDIYLVLPIFGAIFLAIRARAKVLLLDFSPIQLGGLGALSGFALYTFRPSLIFVAAVLCPWQWLAQEVKALIQSRSPLSDRIIRNLIFVFLFLYIYLAISGGVLLSVGGQRIKLDPKPNFQIAILLGVWMIAKRNFHLLRTKIVASAGATVLGMGLGFSPEWITWVRWGRPVASWADNSSYTPWSAVWSSWRELVLGHAERSPSDTGLWIFPLALLVLSLSSLFKKALSDERFQPAAAILGLNLVAFLNIHMTSQGATRYWFAVYPVLWLAIGVLWDSIKLSRAASVLVYGLILFTCSYQVIQRRAWAESPATKQTLVERMEVVRIFKESGIRHVISDDYWETLPYTFLANSEPTFTSPLMPWPEPQDWKLARDRLPKGVLLSGKIPPEGDQVSLAGGTYQLTLLSDLGRLKLYRATQSK